MSDRPATGVLRRWRLPLVWIAILAISTAVQTFTVLDDSRKVGFEMSLASALLREISSHFMWLVLLPAIYWLNRRFPIQKLASIPVHALATVPVSLAHVLGMVALRWIFAGPLNVAFSYAFTIEHLLYEYRKDLMTYITFAAAYVALGFVFARLDGEAASPAPAVDPIAEPLSEPPPAGSKLRRIAVRKKDREVLVSVDDIDWIEAAGNYAILHVGAERHEIRSTLARLENDLDPASFVRVHKSSIVNIARVREVEPWFNGDWRIHLQDGTVVALSRRYRARFEEVVPVRR